MYLSLSYIFCAHYKFHRYTTQKCYKIDDYPQYYKPNRCQAFINQASAQFISS